MRISAIRTFLMQAGGPRSLSGGGAATTATGLPMGSARHWLFVRVETDSGLHGVGEGSGWPVAIEAGVRDIAPLLIGEDPRDIERLWLKMHVAMSGHGLVGTVGGGVATAIEMALWDLKGKALGTPVWNLLGGRVRDRVRVYAHASTPDQARAAVALGYTAIKAGGVVRPHEKIAALREAIGPDIDLCTDLHGPPALTTKDALILGRLLEPYRLLFWEDPVAPENLDGMRRLRDAVAIPLAAGERWSNIWGFAPLLRDGLVDVIQPDGGRCGGISQMKKIAAMAEAAFVQVAPHAGSLGPIGEMASLHVLAAIPNALILERFARDWEGRDLVVDGAPELVDGHVIVPDAPGLGIDIVEDEIARHPPGTNCEIRGTAAVNSYEPGTFGETVYVQMRLRRQTTLSPLQKV